MTNINNLSTNKSYICANCNQIINDRYMLQALDKMWHEDCLKCACCDCRLGETGSTLYLKANLILCKRDYLRLFGMTGHCASCQRLIPAFDLVMRCGELVYHLNCFSCYECQQKFCVGDRYFLYNNQILCEDDHERTRKTHLSSSTDAPLYSK
ncbi:unnamed protein product [Adineta ricciae]|uniref:LIM zinc-binding domain-containing protein n=1 Tax=Adineta ricciae TaxID=249248 RepID=A0A815VTX7_ADIRI|nr:unnamed protein product [Adineta ricciae]